MVEIELHLYLRALVSHLHHLLELGSLERPRCEYFEDLLLAYQRLAQVPSDADSDGSDEKMQSHQLLNFRLEG